MDGYSEECYSLVDTSIFENLQYFPHRLKYDVDLNALNAQTATLTSAEMLKKNSQKLVKDVGPIRFNAYADFGRPFLVGDSRTLTLYFIWILVLMFTWVTFLEVLG